MYFLFTLFVTCSIAVSTVEARPMKPTTLTQQQLLGILQTIMPDVQLSPRKGGLAPFMLSHPDENRIEMWPKFMKTLRSGKVSPDYFFALGLLGHELGHIPTAKDAYTPNEQGGTTFSAPRSEELANAWAYQNMRRIVNAFGYRPHLARAYAKKASAALRNYYSNGGL